MRLKWLEVDRFRNLSNQKTELHPRFNLLLGQNGQGKTNFLEAVGYLGSLRSFRSAGRREMIAHGGDLSRISGSVSRGPVENTVAVTLTPSSRTQVLDDRRVGSPEEYLQILKVIHFIPEDVGLVSGSPSWRRKVIDRAVFEVVPGYVSEYRKYLFTLRQRNALLRKGGGSRPELDSWNDSLSSNGAVLVNRRLDLIAALEPFMEELGETLGLPGRLSLSYTGSYQGENCGGGGALAKENRASIRERILAGITRLADKEIRSGHSMVGPHRDRISFTLRSGSRNLDLSRYGSQGQKRSAVLAFKLALARNLHRESGTWPLLLFDDVASELDAPRREALGRVISAMGAQFFISSTGEEYMFLPAREGTVFNVAEGRLRPR